MGLTPHYIYKNKIQNKIGTWNFLDKTKGKDIKIKKWQLIYNILGKNLEKVENKF